MTVLTFEARFVPRVRDGSKTCTIRRPRKKPITVGRRLSLRYWTGRPYMSPQATICETVCAGIHSAVVSHLGVTIDGQWTEPTTFALLDGFDSFEDLRAWFARVHGLPCTGTLIRWQP